MRLDVRRVETIKKGEEMLGNRTRVKIVKNKVAPPFKKSEFDIMYGTGISLAGDILDTATEIGIIEKAGSWYSYNGERIGQGRENVKTYLEEHPDVLEDVRSRVMKHFEDSKKPEEEKGNGIRVDEDGVVIED
jgi:recombination protein RecA